MSDQKVKGTMMVEQVRLIRSNKQLNWNKYLVPEDWKVINSTILPSAWYPLDTYRRCGKAVFQLLAHGNTEIVRLRGRVRGKELFETTYKHVVFEPNTMNALSSFVNIYGQLFNVSPLGFKKITDKHATISHDYDHSDPGNLPFCYQLMGHLDTLIEMTGGKNHKIEMTKKLWEGANATIFDIQWE